MLCQGTWQKTTPFMV